LEAAKLVAPCFGIVGLTEAINIYVSLSGSDRHPMQLKAQSSNLRLYFSGHAPYPMRVTSPLTATYYYGFFGYTPRPGVARS
jgi:hypothetical protein